MPPPRAKDYLQKPQHKAWEASLVSSCWSGLNKKTLKTYSPLLLSSVVPPPPQVKVNPYWQRYHVFRGRIQRFLRWDTSFLRANFCGTTRHHASFQIGKGPTVLPSYDIYELYQRPTWQNNPKGRVVARMPCHQQKVNKNSLIWLKTCSTRG